MRDDVVVFLPTPNVRQLRLRIGRETTEKHEKRDYWTSLVCDLDELDPLRVSGNSKTEKTREGAGVSKLVKDITPSTRDLDDLVGLFRLGRDEIRDTK